MNEGSVQAVRQVYQELHQANVELFQIWKSDILFSWRWWIELSLSVIPWVLWFLYRKKNSTGRLLHAGFAVIILSGWLDFFGVCLGLWYYPVKLIPTLPSYVAYDFTLLPVTTMFLLQFRPKWNPFLKACVLSGLTSFIGEPLFIWLRLYKPVHWKHIYSFPILIGIYLIANWVSRTKTYEKL